MIPIRTKHTNISSEIAAGRKLHEKIKLLANEAAERTIKTGDDLNSILADISKREKFNQLQIQRLVEESNTVTYNKKYDKLRGSFDRRIEFPIASLDGVVSEMGTDAPPEEKNPNIASGEKGNGEMNKAASTSIEPSYLHNPHTRLDERKEKYEQKLKVLKDRRTEQEKSASKHELNHTIFKIANSLVMTEKMYKTANEVFNTLLSDVSLPETIVEGISKKASDISKQLVATRRARKDFEVILTESPTEKIASHILGEYSLLKEAEDPSAKVKPVKLHPTADISDYQQLIRLAQKLQQDVNQSVSPKKEVNP